MKTLFKIIMLTALLSFITGCNRLPLVNAKSIRYESSYPIGGTTIVMTGVHVTETEVKAESYSRKSRWWYVNQDITIEGYSRQRTPADKAAPDPIPPVQ